MNTGSRDEQMMLNNIARCAKALERIAKVMEGDVIGPDLRARDVEDAKAALSHDQRDRLVDSSDD